ncbi:hypothetical protein FJW05_02390 [Mesorhizobium sp. B2-9-1]|uniref:hypothetical protein n=1 Tax=Mesorhizobium sp. B2-9-1 TaxID=2589898 RepID=UPI001128F316|nr:hypothetical protein [Mesorhizobium sp. B2-9-1]TPI49935.1 hypothetical protein FJW05_02390 [Mesorhizobium sp. B2-9-1]
MAVIWVSAAVFENVTGRPNFPEVYVEVVGHDEQLEGVMPGSEQGKSLDRIARKSTLMQRIPMSDKYPNASYYEWVYFDESARARRMQKAASFLEVERDRIVSEYRRGFLYRGMLPPLLLLALGAAIGWALAGFHRAAQ